MGINELLGNPDKILGAVNCGGLTSHTGGVATFGGVVTFGWSLLSGGRYFQGTKIVNKIIQVLFLHRET